MSDASEHRSEAQEQPAPREGAVDRARELLSRWLFGPLFGMTAADWWGLLRAHGRAIPPRYWPRTLATTVVSLGNSRAARREERLHGAAVAATEVRAPVFVLGHYRSGTTHLHNLLARDPAFCFTDNLRATHPRTFLTTEAQKRRWGGPLTMRRRPQDAVQLDLEQPAEDELALCSDCGLSPHLAWHFPRTAGDALEWLDFKPATEDQRARWRRSLVGFAKKLSYACGGRTPVFKSPCHTARMALILEAFPDARFVHIRRDPLAVYQSTMHMEATVPPHFAYQKRDPARVEELVLRRYARMYDAWFEDLERAPAGQVHELRYEDLKRAPLETLAALYAALGLGDFEARRADLEGYLGGLAGYRKNRYAPLPPETARRVGDAWARTFDAWGYARPGGPPAPEPAAPRLQGVS